MISHQMLCPKRVKQDKTTVINLINHWLFVEYIENCNNFKEFLKTDSELGADDDLALKSNRMIISKYLQNHYVIPLAQYEHLEFVKTKGLLRTKVYFPKLDELVETLLAKCRKVGKKHQQFFKNFVLISVLKYTSRWLFLKVL